MPKRNTTSVPCAITFAEAEGLSQAERIMRFKIESSAGQRAFAGMAKLFRAMEANLAPGEAIFPLLIGAGIKKGTVSNASIAASVYDLVRDGKMLETEFDQLSFNDCWQTKRVLSKGSKKQLSVDAVVTAIRERNDFADEFAALYEHGITAEEKAAKEAEAKSAKEAKEAEAKKQADADKKELETLRAREAELKKQADQKPKELGAKSDAPPAKSSKPDAKSQPPEPPEEEELAEPLTAELLIEQLTEIELAMAQLSDGEQSIVGAKLVEMASAFVESGKPVAKRKKQLLAA